MFDFSSDLGLAKSDLMGLNECFAPVERKYNKGEIITICAPENDFVGIVRSGIAYLATMNTEEQRRITDFYRSGDYFGVHFLPNTDNKSFYVYAKTKCTVDFIKYDKLINCCEKHCKKHSLLIDRVLSQNIRRTVEHIDVIGQRTLRSKLLSFLEYMKQDYGKSTFTMPLPYSDLAIISVLTEAQ